MADRVDTLSLSLESGADDLTIGMHVAFTANTRQQVDEFFDGAVKAGAFARHAPRHWPEYRAYCAFVNDPAGNNTEAVLKERA